MKITDSIVRWLKPRTMDLLKKQIPVQTVNDYLRNSNSLRGFINFFGIDLMKYNVVDELNFIVEPALKRIAGKQIYSGLQKLGTDTEIYDVVNDFIDSAIKECSQRQGNKVNIFGIDIFLKDLHSLKESISQN